MNKRILITGATDGLGKQTAHKLAKQGHELLLHGRSEQKLSQVADEIGSLASAPVHCFTGDLSDMQAVMALAKAIGDQFDSIDVLLNNAGIFRSPVQRAPCGLDIRFAVNTYAPYILSRSLLPLLKSGARVINVASAAQAPVDLESLAGKSDLDDEFNAYAQSKLALIHWTFALAQSEPSSGIVWVPVNPASMLGSKMVQQGFGVRGKDLSIGVDIFCRAALSDEFATANGRYYDNDIGSFADPHTDALDGDKNHAVLQVMDRRLQFSERRP